MELGLNIVQIALSLILLTLILIQSKGVGLSGSFGGGGEVYFARRGAEKVMFILTIIISIAFITNSIATVILL